MRDEARLNASVMERLGKHQRELAVIDSFIGSSHVASVKHTETSDHAAVHENMALITQFFSNIFQVIKPLMS